MEELIVNHVHTLFLQSKSEESKEYNPNLRQAMSGPFSDEYWKAASKEIDTLEEMGACHIVECDDDMNDIHSTWAFKLKRYPDGLVKKFKAWFCARGDQQLEGIYFFKTYANMLSRKTGVLYRD